MPALLGSSDHALCEGRDAGVQGVCGVRDVIKHIRIDVIHDDGAVASTLFGLDASDRVRVVHQDGSLGDARLSAAILKAGADVMEAVRDAQGRDDSEILAWGAKTL